MQTISSAAASQKHHISVCICTFKRAELLKQLLDKLNDQQTGGLFTFSVVIADNDKLRSAESVVAEFSRTARSPVIYCSEPQQNIAMARNKALQNATGDLIAFIDDDEFPADGWLCNLVKTYDAFGVAGVLGPVKPFFQNKPPEWAVKGRFFERPSHTTGFKIGWSEARTGNVLFARTILNGLEAPFSSEFSTAGEDVDFFRRMSENNCTFIWCDEAVVYEILPPSRCTRTYLLRRALLRGSNFRKHPTNRIRNGVKSLIAVPCYTLALPILALFGQAVFLRYLIRLCDHVSRLLGFLGVKLMTQRQM